jgi:xanthine dehydrogenase YagS FAD-binding subunit
MNKFEYASPTTKEQAVALLGREWGETEILAGGTDLLSLMKDLHRHAEAGRQPEGDQRALDGRECCVTGRRGSEHW